MNKAKQVIEEVVREIGGSVLIVTRSVGVIKRIDRRETVRMLVRFGYESIGLGIILSVFVGGILVFLANIQVQKYGVRSILGWASGYAILREFGPLFIALAMTGRVGARNAAEVASMAIGGQIEGLRGVGVNPNEIVVGPRMIAGSIGIGMVGTVSIMMAVIFAAVFGHVVVKVEVGEYFRSFGNLLSWKDVVAGQLKMFAYGGMIALVSTRCGIKVKGGSRATGRAAARSVVVSAAILSVIDWVMTLGMSKMLQ